MVLTKYIDPLPIPGVVHPIRKDSCSSYYEVDMRQFTQQLHSQLPPATVWGYNGSYPGPTFEVKQGEKVKVK